MVCNNYLASYPGPSVRGGRAWYTLRTHAPGYPRKIWGNRILSYTLRIHVHASTSPWPVTMEMRPVTMKTPAHVHAMCTRPFVLLLLKGLGDNTYLSDGLETLRYCAREIFAISVTAGSDRIHYANIVPMAPCGGLVQNPLT